MAIRKYNPTSPGTRFQTVAVFDELTSTTPHKPLVERWQRYIRRYLFWALVFEIALQCRPRTSRQSR